MFCSNHTYNCSSPAWNATIAPNPDIAGIGVLLSFLLTWIISMMIPPVLLSLDYYSDFDPQSAGSIAKLNRQMWLSLERTWSQVILLLKQRSIYKSIIPSHGSNPVTRDGWIRFLRKTLLSFSDQQLATGIGIQVAGWAQVCDMSFHHWATVYALASISHQTHFLTVLNLRPYFQANRRLSKIRISCMLINALLLISYGVIVSLGNAAVDIDSMSYVYCVFHLHRHNDDFGKNLSIKSVVFGVWALIGIVFTLLSAAFYLLKGRWSSFTLGCAIGAVVPTVVLVGETLSSQQALGTYRWMDGDDERNMSFGQILPLLLLFLPILTALEEFEEARTATAEDHDHDQDHEHGDQVQLLPVAIASSSDVMHDTESAVSTGRMSLEAPKDHVRILQPKTW